MKSKYVTYSMTNYPTVTALLKDSCSRFKGEPLFYRNERNGALSVDYTRWEHDLLETAARVQKLEAKHIGVICDLSYECLLTIYSIMTAGRVVVPLEADLTGKQVDEYAAQLDIDLILYHKERLDGACTVCPCMLFSDFFRGEVQPLNDWPEWEGDRDACIFLTSGTEGRKRGVVLTQKNMSFTNSYVCHSILKRNARIVVFLPTHHVLSLLIVTSSIYEGTLMYLSKSIKYLSRDIETYRPDALISVPMINEAYRASIAREIEASGKKEQLYRLVRLSNLLRKIGIDLRTPLFRSLRASFKGLPQLIVTGGAASDPETVSFFADFGISLTQGYGMTETSGIVAANGIDDPHITSVGFPLSFNEVRIQDGEIQIKGENVMKGYYKDPEATEKAFDGPWFRTGDLGRFDKDGRLYITGRKKNLIILSNGENISPEELERALCRCSQIAECVVSEKDGHLHAEIYPVQVPEASRAAQEDEIRGYLAQVNRSNPVYQHISSLSFRSDPFEKTSSMKIRRNPHV